MKKTVHDKAPSTLSAVTQASRLVRRKAAPIALEQRFMFDGAAVAEAIAVSDASLIDATRDAASVDGTAVVKSLVTTSLEPTAITSEAMSLAQQRILDFLQQPDALQRLTELFPAEGLAHDRQWLADAQAWLEGAEGTLAGIRIELRSQAELQGALGSYARVQDGRDAVIYLNADWVAHEPGAQAIARVLVEEYGHAIDDALNRGVDSSGDEGEAFAATVLNLQLSDAQRDRIASENDQRTLMIDGVSTQVENASITFSGVFSGTPTSLSEEAQSLDNIQPITGTGFTFTSSNPADVYFSGNNVTGVLSYTDGNGDPQTIYGVASRLFKTGNTVDGIYFYAPGADGVIGSGDAGETAYLMVINPVFATGSNNGTSSDPVDSALNNLVLAYQAPTAYADSSASPGAQAAIEQGLVTAGQNATGNVLSNDTGSAAATVTSVGTSSAGTTVTAGTTNANLSGGVAVVGEHGTLYIAADGTYRYEVDNGDPQVDALLDSADTLTDQFTYELTDAEGNTATARLTVTIQGSNDAPVAHNDTNSAKESLRTDNTAYDATDPLGSVAEGNVLDNDTDVDSAGLGETEAVQGFFGDGDYVSFTPGTAITNMTFAATQNLSSVAGGEYAYLLVSGTYYLLKDGTTAITVNTNTQNADGTYSIALSAESDNYTVANGASVAFWQQAGTPANSFTSAGGKKTATVSTSTSLTTSDVTINNVTGTPTVGMTLTGTNIPGGATITEVVDNGSGSYTLTVDVQITTAPSGSIGFSGAAGTDLTGQYGTLNLAADGSYTYTPFANNPNLAAGQVVSDSFEYTMVDSDGATSTAILTIKVTGSASTDPNALDDSNLSGAIEAGGAANTGGSPATGSVLTNDTTPSGSNTVVGGRAATATTEQVIAGGSYQDINGAHGTLRLNSNGTYVYTVRDTDADVQALNVGDTLDDVFSYRIRNTAGGEDVATLTITVNGANDHPQATDDTYGATEDTAQTFTAAQLLGNDADVDNTGASLSILSVDNAVGGTVVLNGDGSVTFTPTADFNGTASFTYTMTDGGGTSTATVTINVAPVNDAPLAEPNAYETSKNTTLTGINILSDIDTTDGKDSDAENDTLAISKVNGLLFNANSTDATYSAANGWMELALNHGTLFVKQDGSTVYMPATDDVAGDNFTYVISDGQDESSPATVTLAVNDPANTPAVIAGDADGAVTEDAATPTLTDSGTLSVSDTDSGEASFLTDASDITASAGALGSLSITSAGVWTYSVPNADVQYLKAGETKTETFTVKSADGTTHDVVVVITGVNDAAVIGGDAAGAVTEDTTSPTLTDSGTLTISDADSDENSFQTTGITASAGALGSLSITSAGVWTYSVPNADVQYLKAGETKTETFTVKAADGTTHDVVVVITGVNDAAVIGGDAAGAVTEDTTSPTLTDSGTLTISDADTGEASFQTTGITASAGALGSLSITSAGVWTYSVPNADVQYLKAGETKTETFTVKSADGTTHDVVVVITGVNDAAVIGGDADGAVTEDAATPTLTDSGTLTISDADTGENSFQTTGITASAGALGSLSITSAGVWTYSVPNADVQYLKAGETKTETFTVKSADGTTHDVVVVITGVNDAAVIAGDAAGAVTEDAATPTLTDSGTLTISDADTGEASFQTTGITASAGALGSLSITSAGVWTYSVPNADVQYLKAGETKTETFTVKAVDGTTHDVVVVITGVNDAAVIGGDAAGAVTEDTTSPTLTDSGTLTISDADTGEASFQTTGITASAGALGSLSITSAGVWTYSVPNADVQYLKAGETKTETFTVKSADGTTHDVVVVITGVNDAAVIGGDADGAVTEDAATPTLTDSGTLTISDADTGENSFQTTGITASAGALGSLSITSAGVWTYSVPNADVQYLKAGETKTETFTVKSADGTTHDVVVVITGVNDAAVIAGDAAGAVTEDAATPTLTDSGTLTISDADTGEASFQTTGITASAGALGSLSITSAGVWTYSVPNADVQYLKAGETKTETFTVKAADGTTHDVVVVITGVNDAAVIGGDAAGAVTEDTTSPTLTDSGTLTISDADTGENSFQTTGITASAGALGSLSITSAGVWTYTVANADVQYLNPGESKTETFTVRSTDGSTHDVVIVIHGVDDDRAVTVAGLDDVSEGSNAIFTVALPGGNTRATEISLALSTGTAEAEDYSALTSASAYYFDGNGDKQPLTITAGKITLPAGVNSFFVSVPSTQDSGLEGAEAFSLSATVTGGKSASDSSTILDDGSGKVYNEDGTDSGTPGNDDRAVTVAGLDDVSEGSNAIFTVALPGGNTRATEIGLALSTGTAEAEDYSALTGASAYYFDGNGDKQPLTITAGKITLPAGVNSFFVSVPSTQDSGLEGAEAFSLSATVTGGKSASDSSTILDDGSGKVYNEDGTDSGTPGNDDRAVTVAGLDDVSEGSNAIFTVALPGGNTRATEIGLALSTGTAEAEDYSALTGASAYYFDGNGDKQPLTITAGKITLPAGVNSFFVSVPSTQDSGLEGAEAFSLSATVTGGKSASDSSTILDDGSGKVYNEDGTDSGTPGNDDRAVTVAGLDDVSEGSNAIFTVALPGGNTRATEISLALSTGTAEAEDYSALTGASAYYFDGNGDKQPLTITAGKITLPAGVNSFFVSVPSTQDSGLEGAEAFSLSATVTGGKSASDSSTILDDGSGKVYNEDGTDSGTPGNDDRAVTVAGLDDVSEGSNAIFTVALPGGNTRATEISLALSTGTAEAEDYSALTGASAYYFDGNGDKQPLTITAGKITLPAGVNSFFVSVPSTQDSGLEGAEAFSLSATVTGGKSASDSSTILDDGSGKVYNEDGTDSGTPGNDDRAVTVAGLDDVSEGSNAIFTVALPGGNTRATEIGLALSTGTAEAEDYSALTGASAYYFDGNGDKQPLTITAGKITLPAGVNSFFVSVPSTQDSGLEGAEAFSLSATVTGGKSASDSSTILDDGSGKVYNEDGTDSGTPGNDDRPVPVLAPEAAAVEAPAAVVQTPETSVPHEPLRFDSTTFVAVPPNQQPQLSAEVLALIQRNATETEAPSTLTRATGFQVLVNQRQSGQLELHRAIDKQFVETGAQGSIALPIDTFTHSDPTASITLAARLSDGQPLPSWVRFDPRTGMFKVLAPAGYAGELDVEVSARDDKGNEVKTKFRLTVGAKPAAGREGLTGQLRQASKTAFAWRDAVRGEPAAAPAREAAPAQRVQRVEA